MIKFVRTSIRNSEIRNLYYSDFGSTKSHEYFAVHN